jgi:DNA-binding response OmpR family regulator
MRILLVDDEEDFISALAERLVIRGYDAQWATNAKDALRMANAECFDVSVLDVKMPGVSGLALKKQLAQCCPKTHFIFVTGHGSEEAYQAGIAEAGKENYLIKPISIDVLLNTIRRITEA